MLRFLAMLLAAVALAGSPAPSEAKRLGGARSIGVQRNVPPPAPPAQATRPASAAPAAAPAPAAQSRWLPMLGGLALGGLLGSMFGGSGVGLALLLGLLLIAVAAATRMLRPRAQAAGPLGYASLGGETVAAPPPSQWLDVERREPAAPAAAIPPGFDRTAFLRAAKMNFIRLQDANDRRDFDTLRELTTAEMYALLSEALRRGEAQHTDVVTLEADLLELATETATHYASVRFRGLMREKAGAEPLGFEEIWNLQKPVDGSSGWLLAGIQQLH